MTFSTTPTAEQLRTLSTVDLVIILLRSLQDQPNPNNILRNHEHAHSQNGESDADYLLQRVSDAWAWLVANGLVGPHHRNSPSDWYRVTERGQEVPSQPPPERSSPNSDFPRTYMGSSMRRVVNFEPGERR